MCFALILDLQSDLPFPPNCPLVFEKKEMATFRYPPSQPLSPPPPRLSPSSTPSSSTTPVSSVSSVSSVSAAVVHVDGRGTEREESNSNITRFLHSHSQAHLHLATRLLILWSYYYFTSTSTSYYSSPFLSFILRWMLHSLLTSNTFASSVWKQSSSSSSVASESDTPDRNADSPSSLAADGRRRKRISIATLKRLLAAVCFVNFLHSFITLFQHYPLLHQQQQASSSSLASSTFAAIPAFPMLHQLQGLVIDVFHNYYNDHYYSNDTVVDPSSSSTTSSSFIFFVLSIVWIDFQITLFQSILIVLLVKDLVIHAPITTTAITSLNHPPSPPAPSTNAFLDNTNAVTGSGVASVTNPPNTTITARSEVLSFWNRLLQQANNSNNNNNNNTATTTNTNATAPSLVAAVIPSGKKFVVQSTPETLFSSSPLHLSLFSSIYHRIYINKNCCY